MRLHASDDEFDRGDYHSTIGVITTQCTADIQNRTTEELLDEATGIAVAMADAEHEVIA